MIRTYFIYYLYAPYHDVDIQQRTVFSREKDDDDDYYLTLNMMTRMIADRENFNKVNVKGA